MLQPPAAPRLSQSHDHQSAAHKGDGESALSLGKNESCHAALLSLPVLSSVTCQKTLCTEQVKALQNAASTTERCRGESS